MWGISNKSCGSISLLHLLYTGKRARNYDPCYFSFAAHMRAATKKPMLAPIKRPRMNMGGS
jgi:hypothetical protein